MRPSRTNARRDPAGDHTAPNAPSLPGMRTRPGPVRRHQLEVRGDDVAEPARGDGDLPAVRRPRRGEELAAEARRRDHLVAGAIRGHDVELGDALALVGTVVAHVDDPRAVRRPVGGAVRGVHRRGPPGELDLARSVDPDHGDSSARVQAREAGAVRRPAPITAVAEVPDRAPARAVAHRRDPQVAVVEVREPPPVGRPRERAQRLATRQHPGLRAIGIGDPELALASAERIAGTRSAPRSPAPPLAPLRGRPAPPQRPPSRPTPTDRASLPLSRAPIRRDDATLPVAQRRRHPPRERMPSLR